MDVQPIVSRVLIILGIGFFLGQQSANAPESSGVVGEAPQNGAPADGSGDLSAEGSGAAVPSGNGAPAKPAGSAVPANVQFAVPAAGDVWAVDHIAGEEQMRVAAVQLARSLEDLHDAIEVT